MAKVDKTVKEVFALSQRVNQMVAVQLQGVYAGKSGRATLELKNADGPDWVVEVVTKRKRGVRKAATAGRKAVGKKVGGRKTVGRKRKTA